MHLRCIFLLLLLLSGCTAGEPQVRAVVGAVEAVNAGGSEGFARVLEPRPFSFPADHGPHPEYQTEWWYYTGNLAGPGGRRFGFQLTFFRRALTPAPVERSSTWASNDLYMAHFALSDVQSGQFYAFERFSRNGVGLAGAGGEPFRVFLEDWSAEGNGPEGMTMHLRAAEGDVALDLRTENTRPPLPQGERGLSQKGPSSGNASYYYSLTRMAASGQISIGEQRYPVSGLAWMDREWSTSALEGDLVGWDWFALQLDNGADLMFYRLRQADGNAAPFTAGSLFQPDGTVVQLTRDNVTLEELAYWRSPRSGATYPSGWRLRVAGQDLLLEITPLLKDQELPVSVLYWEGAVQVSGSAQGYGYVELTGYAQE